MQPQAVTIDQFNSLFQEIPPKLEIFKNKIINSGSYSFDFFKNLLNSGDLEFFEDQNCIIIETGNNCCNKPKVFLKFSVTSNKTKCDNIVNMIAAIGVIYFIRNNIKCFTVNPIIIVEKITPEFNLFA